MAIPSIQPTPAALVENGRIHTGFFHEPFRKVNLLDAPQLGGALGRPLRWLRLKEWVGFAFEHPQFYGAMIIQDAKYAASATVYLVDRRTAQRHEWLVVAAPGQVRLPETLWHGESRCVSGGDALLFDHDLAGGRHHVRVHLRARGQVPELQADLVLHQDLARVAPLVVSLPIGARHHTYTHKSPLRLAGTLRLGDATVHYDPQRDFGNLDEQKTWYPYRSRWHWGTFVGLTRGGRHLALNLANQMTPRDAPGEDALWLDGRLILMPSAEFHAVGDGGNYRIADPAGRIRLQFVADGAKREARNWGLAAIDYAQHYGRYVGEITDDTGEVHALDGLYGVVERMAARF